MELVAAGKTVEEILEEIVVQTDLRPEDVNRLLPEAIRAPKIEFDASGNVRTGWTAGYPDALRDENRTLQPRPVAYQGDIGAGQQMIADGATLEQVAKATERSPAQAKVLFRAELRERENPVVSTAAPTPRMEMR